MKKIFAKLIEKPRLIVSIFVILLVFSIVSYPKIRVNYKINDYLPEKSDSSVAIDKMKEEFDEDIFNVRVMLPKKDISEVLDTISAIKMVDGVKTVSWLSDFEDVMKPMDFMDQKHLDSYYKDGSALINIAVDEDKAIESTEAIREIIGDEAAMTGSAVNTAIATTNSVNEIIIVTIIGVLFTILILILTTDAWIEPVIIMLSLATAILINAGTNIIFGEISFVTNAAGNILLLAVSMDYTVFVMHRFKEEKLKTNDKKVAMIEALDVSFSSILSSALTTIIGFLDLVFMQFKIGTDLGLALAKGVFISLLTVFTLAPIIILHFDKYIDKTSHKRFIPSFDGFARHVFKHKSAYIVVFLLLIVPSFLAASKNSYYFGTSHIFGPDTKLGQDNIAIEEKFGAEDNYAILVPLGNLEKERRLSDDLRSMSKVKSVISYVDMVGETIPTSFLDESDLKKLNSDNYTRMIVSVDADFEGEDTYKLIDDIKAAISKYYGEYYLLGEGVSTYDLKNTVTADMTTVNIIAIAAVFIVLLLTEKSLSLPILLVAAIETAIYINMSVPYYRSSSVFYIAYLIISSIQLGATVDYAILLSERYLEERKSLNKADAAINTVSMTAVSILTSATAMIVVGILLGKFSTHGLISQLGYLLAIGTTASLVIVLFVLPGLLYSLDGLIQKTTKNTEFVN